MPNSSDTPMPSVTEPIGDGGSPIQLAQFLKFEGLVGTGGEAKLLIQRGDVRVNGAIETRRGRRLHPGDAVELAGSVRVVPPISGDR